MTDTLQAIALVAGASPDGADGPSGPSLAAALRASGLLEADLSTGDLFTALSGIGGASLSAGRIFEGHVNAIKLLDLYGGRQGGLCGIWGADGPDPVRVEGDRLKGQKLFASGADVLDHVLISARLDDALQLLLIHTRKLNGRLFPDEWNVSGMKATASGRCDLTDFPLKDATPVGGPGDYLKEPHFQGGVWRYGAVQYGAMRRLTAITAAQLRKRGHDNAPLQATRLRRMVTASEGARLWLWQAAEAVERPGAGPETAEASILARLVTAEAAVEVLNLMDEALGAASFAAGHPVERIRRDLGFYIRQANPDGLALDCMSRILDDPARHARWIG